MSVLLDIDPLSGALSSMQYDHNTKDLIITKRQNVDALLDRNVASYNDPGQGWRGADNDFWHVASVDLVTLMDWLSEFNAPRAPDCRLTSPFLPDDEWGAFMDAKLNSSDFRKFRTAPVRI